MAPKASLSKKQKGSLSPDPNGMFRDMVVFLVEKGVQSRRILIWRQKLTQMGAVIDDNFSKRVTHILAMNSNILLQQVSDSDLKRYKGVDHVNKLLNFNDDVDFLMWLLCYQWLENCLKSGEKLPEDSYVLKILDVNESDEKSWRTSPEPSIDGSQNSKKIKLLPEDSKVQQVANKDGQGMMEEHKSATLENQVSGIHVEGASTGQAANLVANIHDDAKDAKYRIGASNIEADASQHSSPYSPPDLNKNITQIFGKLIDIYRALGDDRRSFSYYKAIPVIEKLPFKIESVDQVKDLPTIGKALQDHIHEIITTGKLSKLEHFENDEKVRTVSLFGDVWGIGPATALKLYEKGYRTLDDLRQEESLTNAQRIGLKYFHDIKKRIPRHEVKDMEMLLKKTAQEVLPGVIVVCGGSYRRGKASCGDLDIVITHPDGESHKGFLQRYVRYLKDINFLREDLVFSTHSAEGTDSGVDTYFGLCTYPGQEVRHRIDFKVYPRDRYAFGLIAWTGNDVLNRRLRLLAESKGYRLDDTGLYLASQSSDIKRGMKSSMTVPCYSEKEVFDLLEFPWLAGTA